MSHHEPGIMSHYCVVETITQGLASRADGKMIPYPWMTVRVSLCPDHHRLLVIHDDGGINQVQANFSLYQCHGASLSCNQEQINIPDMGTRSCGHFDLVDSISGLVW